VNLSPAQIVAALGAEVVAEGPRESPRRATINSGEAGPGDLFFGLRGEKRDGGEYAPAAIEAGAWGVVVSSDRRLFL
jgi:UDP-N-acetylmuramoyl-tripeptide--D-alanyl-D-alanine ligase